MCTQHSLLLNAFCSGHAKHSVCKVPFLGAELGAVPERQGYVCPCMAPSSIIGRWGSPRGQRNTAAPK